MTKREAQEYNHQQNRLRALGISREDAEALRRISLTLRRWFEHECNGTIQRDGEDHGDNTPIAYSPGGVRLFKVVDRETGARKRLATIMARYPGLTAYVQTDPRGCALYILTAEQIDSAHVIDSIYNRGIAI